MNSRYEKSANSWQFSLHNTNPSNEGIVYIYSNGTQTQIRLLVLLLLFLAINAPGHQQPSNCHSLTHWVRVTHICFSNVTNIGSDNGFSPGRRQTIIWTNVEYCWFTLRNKLQWNFNRNSNSFIQENIFERVVYVMAANLARAQWFKQESQDIKTSSPLNDIEYVFAG